ncbi:unnamed protein product [Albugo candida]|uniref:Uncharacterized protein n=1 Tax=Albugo candida TaxID=65357 RepID=A0A024GPK2_9STRA|nr:unnamed protein product [Albugo candida]|eukprot:CCI48729.1 unnamed protein product [Albugo candida]
MRQQFNESYLARKILKTAIGDLKRIGFDAEKVKRPIEKSRNQKSKDKTHAHNALVAAKKRAEFSARKLRRLSDADAKKWMVSFEMNSGKVITIPACPDNGADDTVIPESLVKRLVNAGTELDVKSIPSRKYRMGNVEVFKDFCQKLLSLAESQRQFDRDGGLMEADEYLAEDANTVEEKIAQVVTASIKNGPMEEHRKPVVRCFRIINVVLRRNYWVLLLQRLRRCRYSS